MAVNGATEKPNSLLDEEEEHSTVSSNTVNHHHHQEEEEREVTLYGLLNRLIESTFSPNPDWNTPLLHRIKDSLSESVPLFREALRNTCSDVLLWTRGGSPFRALLVVSVGTITLLALTGLLAFMLFFITATVNAIVVCLLISLAAAGGFLAMFFACVTAIYVGAMAIAGFVIFIVTISTIIAALFAAGWIGFFWMVWLATRKSASLAKHSLNKAGASFSAYTSAHHHREPGKGKVSN